jgi:hypothetical protein
MEPRGSALKMTDGHRPHEDIVGGSKSGVFLLIA